MDACIRLRGDMFGEGSWVGDSSSINLLTTKSVDYLNHLFTGVKRNVSYNPSRKLCNCDSPTEGSRPAGWETLICSGHVAIVQK